MSRPLLEIDEVLVEDLASIMCSNKEIASIVGCCVDTLTDRFSEILHKGRQRGKTSLRREQFKAAIGGNVVMLIWLGKQYLEQQDKTQISLEKISDDILVAEAQRRLADGTKP